MFKCGLLELDHNQIIRLSRKNWEGRGRNGNYINQQPFLPPILTRYQ